MRRSQLDALLHELVRISGDRELVIIGSQCVHAVTDAVPAEVLMSRECDVLLDDSDALVAQIDDKIGESSAYRTEHGVFVDTVSSTFPFLPEGWEKRLVPFVVGSLVARCLELYDLSLSKLAAGRLKDYELISALVMGKLLDVETVRQRIGAVADLHMRAILLARLQIIVESMGR